VHHRDAYPAGNGALGVDPALLRGRQMGSDFSGRDGWSMYHGQSVPGFPRHPHRGFETITIARQGHIDHSDSLGATARFGQGDVQWMTAGGGVEHSEMFPLLHDDRDNPTELFQIWLNLPAEDKMREAYFTMFWAERIPTFTQRDDAGNASTITVIAGAVDGVAPLAPPPSSWASRPDSGVAVWTIRQDPGALMTLPAGPAEANRALYCFAGEGVAVDGTVLPVGHVAQLRADAVVTVANHGAPAELLLLQGRPIGEPVVQHGPFVMGSAEEIRQTMVDYQRTGFGTWTFASNAPVHPRDAGRFAVHADGRRETP
jgi:redox-sensitive bicupin YhaK (pirin superfamily)